MHGTCMKYARNMFGICKECAWNMYGIWMGYVWNTHGICMEYGWNKQGTCMAYACNMYGICMAYVLMNCKVKIHLKLDWNQAFSKARQQYGVKMVSTMHEDVNIIWSVVNGQVYLDMYLPLQVYSNNTLYHIMTH